MYIHIDALNKTLQIDNRRTIYVNNWAYLHNNLRKVCTLTYDTSTKEGFLYWLNQNVPPVNLSHPVYFEFVAQLVCSVNSFLGKHNNVIQLQNNIKGHDDAA